MDTLRLAFDDISANLDYRETMNLCNTNRQYLSFCRDNRYWSRKALNLFGIRGVKDAAEYRKYEGLFTAPYNTVKIPKSDKLWLNRVLYEFHIPFDEVNSLYNSWRSYQEIRESSTEPFYFYQELYRAANSQTLGSALAETSSPIWDYLIRYRNTWYRPTKRGYGTNTVDKDLVMMLSQPFYVNQYFEYAGDIAQEEMTRISRTATQLGRRHAISVLSNLFDSYLASDDYGNSFYTALRESSRVYPDILSSLITLLMSMEGKPYFDATANADLLIRIIDTTGLSYSAILSNIPPNNMSVIYQALRERM